MPDNHDPETIVLKLAIARLEENVKVLTEKLSILLDRFDKIPDNRDFVHLEKEITNLDTDMKKLEKEVENIYTMANKWKGGLLVLMALGSIIGWIASFSGSIAKIFHTGG